MRPLPLKSALRSNAMVRVANWIAAERHFEFPMAKQAGFAVFGAMYSWFQFLCGNVDQAITPLHA
jgi:hypothetical protein